MLLGVLRILWFCVLCADDAGSPRWVEVGKGSRATLNPKSNRNTRGPKSIKNLGTVDLAFIATIFEPNFSSTLNPELGAFKHSTPIELPKSASPGILRTRNRTVPKINLYNHPNSPHAPPE